MAAWNNRPRIRDKSDGIWRRMILVPFRIRIEDNEIVRGMDDPDWWIESGELPGILKWAILGLARLLDQNKFTSSQVCDLAKHEYTLETNPARQFFATCVREHNDAIAASEDILAVYQQWCEKSGYRPLSRVPFFKELIRAFPNAKKSRKQYGVERKNCYEGIVLENEDGNEFTPENMEPYFQQVEAMLKVQPANPEYVGEIGNVIGESKYPYQAFGKRK